MILGTSSFNNSTTTSIFSFNPSNASRIEAISCLVALHPFESTQLASEPGGLGSAPSLFMTVFDLVENDCRCRLE